MFIMFVKYSVGHIRSKDFFHNILDVCKELVLSSSGKSGKTGAQEDLMGKYWKQIKPYNDRPVWKHLYNKITGASDWIFYMDGYWIVGYLIYLN